MRYTHLAPEWIVIENWLITWKTFPSARSHGFHLKRILKMNQLRLRGLTGAKDEFLLAATAQNLRRMAKYLGTGPPRSQVEATM